MNRTDKRRPGANLKHFSIVALILLVLLACGTGVAVASSGGAEGGYDAQAPKLWVATDTYRVMNFLVLAAALFFLLRKPVSQALNGRIKGIQEQLSELEAKKKQAEKELADYNARLALLDEEAKELIQTYIQQGKDARERILKEAETTAGKMEQQAKRNIENEFAKAKAALQQEIMVKALGKAEQLVKAKITTEDQDRLVDEYLEKVVA